MSWIYNPPTVGALIDASKLGVVCDSTGPGSGTDNTEALKRVVESMEATGRGAVLPSLPNAQIRVGSEIPLVKSDDSSGRFSYIFRGQGYTSFAVDNGVKAVFRVNLNASDEPVHATSNLIGRIKLENIQATGEAAGEAQLVRIGNGSAHFHNVRGINLDYGAYLVTGYCDHFRFTGDTRWKSENTNGWLFYMANGTNGDGHVFEGVSCDRNRAARFRAAAGVQITGCIGGSWVFKSCDGVEIDGLHCEPFTGSQAIREPNIVWEDSRGSIDNSYLQVGPTYPSIEVKDESTTDASQLELKGGNTYVWVSGQASNTPPKKAHLHVAAATSRTRVLSRAPRGANVATGAAVSDPVGIHVTSGVEGITSAVAAEKALLAADWELAQQNNAWNLRPVGRVRVGRRFATAPSIAGTGLSTGIGGTLAASTKRFYKLAVWDGFNWSNASGESSKETAAKESAIVLTINTIGTNSLVRLFCGTETGVYTKYIDLPTAGGTRITDYGEYVDGLPWITTEVPTPPSANAQQDMFEIAGRRMGWAAGVPTKGSWQRGDVLWKTEPTASSTPGWVCVEAGEPGVWKTMAALGA